MIQIKNFLIKREQSQARLSFAKREKSRLLAKTILTLVALFAISTGAWAEESETITTATKGTTVYTGTHFKITASYNCDADGIYLFSNNHGTATIESLNGENITKIEMHMTYGGRKATKTTTTAGQLVATDSSESANDISVINVNATSVEIGTTVEALDGTVVQIDKFVIYYGAASSGTAGPKVAWDKATKTGQFTMPGGNVTLEPEYYPQAALTAAPTAINDVPATTDGAIVKAGTVANIGSTETAQGTVMYYVSPTALDDAALLALAADQWTADVPTAKSLAQGQAYVYYYVRGNDSDTDEENFSDGDILSANALTVTIAAEPTYDVTYAEGTQDADKWTVKAGTDGSFQSLPLKGVKAGTKVKLKYDGDRSMLKGVKATSDAKPAATVKTITIAADFHTSGHVATAPEITIEYNEGEKWSDVAARYDWLKMYETYTVYYDADSKSGDLHTADGGVKPSDLVDPTKSYYWGYE